MKTTVDIADALLAEAKQEAARRGTTLRALIETGLREVLEQGRRRTRFKLRDASVNGRGVSSEFASGGWERLRAAAYEDRGG